ncbi:MAG: hypothetical protein HC908_11110 [Calothrix sp. SM1_7_51]|nr:hypothetical protein [Calothrix sp. SM1_7_51]
MGEILLKKQDAIGIEYIEKAMAKDPNSVIEGCEVIYFFLQQQGKTVEAQLYLQRAEQHYEFSSSKIARS